MENLSGEELLADLVGISRDLVQNALTFITDYKIVRVKKKRGGYRMLFIPPPLLKQVQRKILNFLKKLEGVESGIYGISSGTSCIQHVKNHIGGKWIFQLDLKDAFSSVDVSVLKNIIKMVLIENMRYFEREMNCWYDEEDLTFSEKKLKHSPFYKLRHLMVKDQEEDNEKSYKGERVVIPWRFPKKEEKAKALSDIIIKFTTYKNILPQGTPTAPFLFGLFLTKTGLLRKIVALSYNLKAKLSIYVDNIVISSQKPLPKEKQQVFFNVIEDFGFKVNKKKVRSQWLKSGISPITGLKINYKGQIVLPKKKIRKWRGLIHRAIFESELRPKVLGFIASLRPIYGDKLPPQLEKPYSKLIEKINNNS